MFQQIACDDNFERRAIAGKNSFGKSEVQRVEGADEFIHIRVTSGRLIRLSLDVLKLSVKSRDGKKRVFKARIE